MMLDPTKRVIAYVDGYNVYHGFKRKGWEQFLWLDYRGVFESITKPEHEIVNVKYFTATSRLPDSRKRQQIYLDALRIRGGLTIFEGKHQKRPHKCKHCGSKSFRYQEKESDVSMAVEMTIDALDGHADELWLMTRDSDLCPAIRAVRDRTGLKVLLVRPPNGSNDTTGGDALRDATGGHDFHVQDRIWKRNQLPEKLQKAKGERWKKRPKEWS